MRLTRQERETLAYAFYLAVRDRETSIDGMCGDTDRIAKRDISRFKKLQAKLETTSASARCKSLAVPAGRQTPNTRIRRGTGPILESAK